MVWRIALLSLLASGLLPLPTSFIAQRALCAQPEVSSCPRTGYDPIEDPPPALLAPQIAAPRPNPFPADKGSSIATRDASDPGAAARARYIPMSSPAAGPDLSGATGRR